MIRKIINDPVYGFITINDPLIFEVISHPFFQRLRRIHQMAFAELVYPGAVHSRLHHALGACACEGGQPDRRERPKPRTRFHCLRARATPRWGVYLEIPGLDIHRSPGGA